LKQLGAGVVADDAVQPHRYPTALVVFFLFFFRNTRDPPEWNLLNAVPITLPTSNVQCVIVNFQKPFVYQKTDREIADPEAERKWQRVELQCDDDDGRTVEDNKSP